MHYVHPLWVKAIAWIADNIVALVAGGVLGNLFGHHVEAWAEAILAKAARGAGAVLSWLKRKV